MDYRLSTQEQELTLTVVRADAVVRVYTSDRVYMRKLDKLHEEHPDVYKRTWTDTQIMGDGLPMGVRYEFPRRYLRFGRPASAAQVTAARANMARINSTGQN